MKKKIVLVIALFGIAFIALQFIHPEIKNPRVTSDIQAPDNVKQILRRACYDCHSNETNLRWYDQIAPIYWQVADDVKKGRKALNFSSWGQMSPTDQRAKLWEAINQIIAGAMPLKNYEMVHPEAKISPEDMAVLKNYAMSITAINTPNDGAKANTADQQFVRLQESKGTIDKLPVALNGIRYMPDYKNWQAISMTDRFDNGTMRIIFGNDIAVRAIQQNEIHPWPNGTIFAKAAWDQMEDTAGNIKTGTFKQVEYMIKDDQKYASTEGWGFARFKTDKLIPYGETPLFTTECVNCHRPMKDADFVFTLPIKH